MIYKCDEHTGSRVIFFATMSIDIFSNEDQRPVVESTI